ncbi:unnamed protein product [Schistosoma rodhaini]|uniref:Uncharacterized protein n=1 Tax=Schistosoma rodhaini TaxID=6188 RepID=A0AA85FPA9_9TREM|nr:unnamed protein product [Schistosoma rodhaini]CAH8566957.1 unnamed protein product [Schistosoma rodhaini]
MLFTKYYIIGIIIYITLMNSIYTYSNYRYNGFMGQSKKDSYEAINFPLKTIHGRKYDMDYGNGFIPDNYGNHDNHDDQEYDSYHSNDYDDSDKHNYGHVNLAEQSMRKLKELKHRKYNEEYRGDIEDEEEVGEYNNRYYRSRDESDVESTQPATEGPRRTTTTPIFTGE